MKTCVRCFDEKEDSEFRKKSRNKDGLENICKKCVGIAEKQCKLKKRDTINRKARERWAANPEHHRLIHRQSYYRCKRRLQNIKTNEI